jgi:predicted acyl esterase
MAVGRDAFIEEVMRFLDLHLKGIKPKNNDPAVEVQDSRGRWRGEASWPPSDAHLYESKLRSGEYTDNGSGSGQDPSEDQGIWSVSQPLPYDAWFSGEPTVKAELSSSAPLVNVAANVYDIDPKGGVTMISRGVQAFIGQGPHQLHLEMYGQDWPIAKGHRIGVLISGADNDEFVYEGTASQLPVTVEDASVSLPFLTFNRTKFLPGEATPRLKEYIKASTASLSKELLKEAQVSFRLPAPLKPLR